MATFSEDYGISEERLEFTDSSENDRTAAKSLWQSFNLQPHMESTLTCCHVKQRMPICSTYKGSACTNAQDHLIHEQNQEEFMKKLAEARKLDEVQRIERYAFIREANRCLLEKHRQVRIQKEAIALKCKWKKCAKQKKVQYAEPCPDVCDQQEDSKVIAEEMKQDIENFERNILGMDDDDCDSDDECNE